MNTLGTVLKAFGLRLLLVSGGVGLLRACSPALSAQAPAAPVWEAARVVRVLDGDTYDVVAGGRPVRVRLLHVDAPEMSQPYGLPARDSVARRVPAFKVVRLCRQGADLFGRTLALVKVDGRRLDSLAVARGWGWAHDTDRATPRLLPQQQAALAARRGLWKCGAATAVPPWIWRSLDARGKQRHRGGCRW